MPPRNGFYKVFYVYSLMFLFISVTPLSYPSAFKVQDSQWSTPQKIPLYNLQMNPPILIADQNRTVHAFSSQWVKGNSDIAIRAIVYNQWSLEQGWTVPVDIILSPSKEARVTGAHLDKNGVWHIVFFGGDNTYADLYYSKAPATLAHNARAWSTPIIIAENAGDPEGAVFAEDDQGTLYVIYNGRQLGNGLYIVKSTDGGLNWSDPNPFFFNLNDEPNTAQLQVIRGKSGRLHVIWGVYNEAGQGRGIYYSSSQDGTRWSNPVLLADVEEGLGTEKPTIIEYNEELFALYILTPKITMRRSRDDGKTWGDPLVVFPRHVGVNGELSLVIDSNNDLHLFFGQRITGSPDIHGMWHSQFVHARWSVPEALIKGPRVVDRDGGTGFDPNFARAVVSQGNVILVTWKTDPAAGYNGVWYSYKKFDAPELPVTELPTPVEDSNFSFVADPSESSTPVVNMPTETTKENEKAIQVSTDRAIFQSNPSLPIIIGSVTAIIAILLATIVYVLDRSK